MSDRLCPGDPLLTAGLDVGVQRALRDLPPDAPLPVQRVIAEAVIARAGQVRTLPRFALRWVAAPRDGGYQHGETTLYDDGALEVVLDANWGPGDLEETLAHELCHVIDYADGLHRTLSRVELEQRAQAFARIVMARR